MKRGQASLVFLLIGTTGLAGACGGAGGAKTPDDGAGQSGSAGLGGGNAGNPGAAGSAGTAGRSGGAPGGAGAGGTAGMGAAGKDGGAGGADGGADAGGAGRDGGAPDTGGAGSGGAGTGGSTLPLTQRPVRGTLQCQITRNRTDHSPRSWNSPPAMVTTTGGSTFLLRPEAINQGAPQLLAGTLNAAGILGTSTVVQGAAADVGELAAAPRGAGFAAVFVEGTALRFAAFDGAGALVVQPKTVFTGVDTLSTVPSLAAGPDGGFGLVVTINTGGDKREVRFVTLSADGAARGTPRTLNAPGAILPFVWPAPSIVSDASGYAMIWRSPTEARGGIDFARVDVAGAETVARRRISVTSAVGTVVGGSAGFDRATNALLAVDGGYIAAWAEAKQGALGDNASSEVRIVRLSASGVAQSAPVPLRAGVKDIDEVEPALVKIGRAAAVAWGRGTHIYICGGCVPDHRIDLLPIDPSDLTPLGNVVSVTNGGAAGAKAGGLLRKQLAVTGTSVLATYQLTFHVSAAPGSAAFSCTPL